MRSIALRCAAWLAALTMGATSVPVLADAPAEASAAALHFDTAITAVYGSPYPIAGKLDISITSDGIIKGYYHNAFQKAFVQVTGGRDGNYVWFDIGPANVDLGLPAEQMNERIHFVGTMSSDGSMHGQIFPNYRGNGEGNSAIAPAPSPTENDQYLFAAKPAEKDAGTTNPSP